MAAPGGKFFIQDRLKDVAPHHESFQVSYYGHLDWAQIRTLDQRLNNSATLGDEMEATCKL